MDFNRAYRDNEDGGVVISSTLEHTIAWTIIGSLREKRNKKYQQSQCKILLKEEMDLIKEFIASNYKEIYLLFFFHFLIHLLEINQILHQISYS